MARQRLINCEFINAASFKVNVSNRAKLLYLMMFMNGDDRGFVDTTQDLINALEKNDNELDKVERLELLENTYNTALEELLDKGYILEFKDNHGNKVHLIKHWFYHNRYKTGLWTNYKNFMDLVHLENNKYVLGNKKPLKEDKLNETNEELNETNIKELLEEPNKKKKTTDNDDLTEEDLPFPVDLKNIRGN